jgi:hypothetical protein
MYSFRAKWFDHLDWKWKVCDIIAESAEAAEMSLRINPEFDIGSLPYGPNAGKSSLTVSKEQEIKFPLITNYRDMNG